MTKPPLPRNGMSDAESDNCRYCGAPPELQDPTWNADEDAYVPRNVCPQCGADLKPYTILDRLKEGK